MYKLKILCSQFFPPHLQSLGCILGSYIFLYFLYSVFYISIFYILYFSTYFFLSNWNYNLGLLFHFIPSQNPSQHLNNFPGVQWCVQHLCICLPSTHHTGKSHWWKSPVCICHDLIWSNEKMCALYLQWMVIGFGAVWTLPEYTDNILMSLWMKTSTATSFCQRKSWVSTENDWYFELKAIVCGKQAGKQGTWFAAFVCKGPILLITL